MRLADRIAIVTGGTGGLGRAVLRELAVEGAKVTTTYIYDWELEHLKKETPPELLKTVAITKTDVLKREEVEKLAAGVMKESGRIDILVNLVGGYKGGINLPETEEKTWDLMLELNLRSAYNCCRAVVPHMVTQKYGKIVSVAARTGLEPSAGDSAYAAAKAGVIALTRALSEEVKLSNVNVNAILPSVIDTEANRRDMPQEDFSLWVRPDEIARVIAFLVSDDANAITGAAIPVYGKS